MARGVHPCTRSGCGLDSTRVVLSDRIEATGAEFDFRICKICGMGFVHPVPSDADLATLYGCDYAYFQPTADNIPRFKLLLASLRYRHLVSKSLQARLLTMAGLAVEMVSRRTISYSLGLPLALPRSTRILEIGCGSGYWLLAMKACGYAHLTAFDVALNPGFRERLNAHGIAALDEGGLDALPAESCDLIRLEHVFEHLSEPVAELQRYHHLLAEAGWLVMTFPSILPWRDRNDLAQSPDRAHLQLPLHLAHHSPESASFMLTQVGFEVVGLRVTKNERFISVAARRSTRR